MKTYPRDIKDDAVSCGNALRYISRVREEDMRDWNNLSNTFMRGRKVGKVPTSSADVATDDRLGDFNYDASYMYLCVDNSGATWRRITLGSW